MGEKLASWEVAYTALAGVALVISVLNNLMTILIVFKNKSMRTVTNCFLANVAISDVCLGGIILPIQLHDISHTSEFHEGKL